MFRGLIRMLWRHFSTVSHFHISNFFSYRMLAIYTANIYSIVIGWQMAKCGATNDFQLLLLLFIRWAPQFHRLQNITLNSYRCIYLLHCCALCTLYVVYQAYTWLSCRTAYRIHGKVCAMWYGICSICVNSYYAQVLTIHSNLLIYIQFRCFFYLLALPSFSYLFPCFCTSFLVPTLLVSFHMPFVNVTLNAPFILVLGIPCAYEPDPCVPCVHFSKIPRSHQFVARIWFPSHKIYYQKWLIKIYTHTNYMPQGHSTQI